MRDLDKYAEQYVNHPGFEARMVCFRRRKVLEILAGLPHARILEIGCGTDSLFNHLTDFESFVVVEPIESFVETAIGHAHGDPRISVLHGFLESQSEQLRSQLFDLVIASSVLHEVEEPTLFLESLNSLCSKQTIAHLNVPNALSLHRLLAVEMGLIEDPFTPSELAKAFQRTSSFDLSSLKELVQSCNFTVLSQGSYFLKPFSNHQMLELVDHEIVPETFLDALYTVVENRLPEWGAEIFVNVRKT
jgi:2-polyprenyl-3-methyl-5-hydroxy-6-metoxy-1,4-benzoquinol methylase